MSDESGRNAVGEMRLAITRIARHHGVSPVIEIQQLDDGTWRIAAHVWTLAAARQHFTEYIQDIQEKVD